MLDRGYVRNLLEGMNGSKEISQSTIAYFRHPEHLIEFLGLVGEALEIENHSCNQIGCGKHCSGMPCIMSVLRSCMKKQEQPKNCSACVVFEGGESSCEHITHETAMKIKELLK